MRRTLSDTENKCGMANLKVKVALKLHFETNYEQIILFKNSRYVKALVINFFIMNAFQKVIKHF